MTDLLDIDDLRGARPEIGPLTDAERDWLMTEGITGPHRSTPAPVARRNRRSVVLAVAVACALLVGGLVVARSMDDDGTITSSSEPDTPQITDPEATVPAVTAPVAVDLEATSDTVIADDGVGTPASSLSKGDFGDDVVPLQQRLAELAFDPGPIDGQFGGLTEQAVWAFEQLMLGRQGDEVTGVVDQAVWERLFQPVSVAPRRTDPDIVGTRHVEVYLPEQVLVVFAENEPVLIAHISSGEVGTDGEPADYCEQVVIDSATDGRLLDEPELQDVCGTTHTPGGVFTIAGEVDGVRNTPIGRMRDPVFLENGPPIHGAANVPKRPMSHGSIRLSQYVVGVFSELVEVGDPVLIWDGTHEPEDAPAQDGFQVAGSTGPGIVEPIDLFAIGDAVMLGAAAELTERGYTVDTSVSRQMQDMIPIMQQLADAGLFGDRVIVHLGTNGPITRDDLESFFATVVDVPSVIVLNVRAERSWTETNNALLAEFDQLNDNIIVIDWNTLADQCVGDCFAADGIHLSADGAVFYADLIGQYTGR